MSRRTGGADGYTIMKYKRILTFLLFFGLALFIVYEAVVTQLPDLWQALRSGDEAAIEAFLADSDRTAGMIYLALLQFIQVVSIFIPSAPIQIAGGMVCGALRAYIICQVTYVFANVLVFWAVRRYSGLNELLGNSSRERVQRALRAINRGDPFVTVMLLCLIPLIPNGFIPYAASQMELRLRSFAAASLLGSCYPIASLVLAGRFILSGDYLISALLIVLNVTVLALVYWKRGAISELLTRRFRSRTGG